MFKKDLKDNFQQIFNLQKITFDQPGESREQDCLFIEIENSWNTFRDGRVRAKVTGSASIFAPNDKIPFGFFSKKISQASANRTSPFFFYDIETNTKRYGNLVQLSFSFVYFFDSQYDPETGSITSVDFNFEEQ